MVSLDKKLSQKSAQVRANKLQWASEHRRGIDIVPPVSVRARDGDPRVLSRPDEKT